MFVYYIEIYVLHYIEIYACILYGNICLHLQPCRGSSIPNLILVTGKSNLGRKGDFCDLRPIRHLTKKTKIQKDKRQPPGLYKIYNFNSHTWV